MALIKSRTGSVLLVAIWAVGVIVGMFVIHSYSNSAGAAGEPQGQWPADCQISRSEERYTLVMFLHPRCPCSRASVAELARIMSTTGNGLEAGSLEACVVFFQPNNEQESWSRTDLWDSAAEIPGVRVMADPDAGITQQFGVEISGHVLLYDPSGQLCFSGGITAGRGHEGDNTGRSAVEALVRGNAAATDSSPVFGCPIIVSQ